MELGEWVETPVYWRGTPRGFKLEGPAVVEERHLVAVVPPRWRVEVGPTGTWRRGERATR